MSEFSLIERFCHGIGQVQDSTIIGVGDDAAVVSVASDSQLAISVDTMVEGVHFLPDSDPADLAHKLLAVNLSDMAAMGAEPKWATLALTLPDSNTQWLAAFSGSLDLVAKRFGLQLIGGDTTRGPLTLTLNIMGLLPKSKALSRSGASVGDAVFVSNVLGDAALALNFLQGRVTLTESQALAVMPALNRPEPQVPLGRGLLDLASACLDVSDGVVADLSHMARLSGVSIELDVADIPLSEVYQDYLAHGGSLDLALTGGDDYQLVFAVPKGLERSVKDLARRLKLSISRVGQVVKQSDELVKLSLNGSAFQLGNVQGYQHFT